MNKPPYKYSVAQFEGACFEEQVLVYEYLVKYGRPSAMPAIFEQLIVAVKADAPSAIPYSYKAIREFYWKYKELQRQEKHLSSV